MVEDKYRGLRPDGDAQLNGLNQVGDGTKRMRLSNKLIAD